MATVASDHEAPAEPVGELSSLGIARARRRLTVEEAAERAGLTPEAVEALEEGRLYRFPTAQEAVAAAVLYCTSLGVGRREARRLAGLPTRDTLLTAAPWARIAAPAAFAVAVALLVWFVVVPRFSDTAPADPAGAEATLLPAPELTPSLPERSEIEVDVLNGSTLGRAATRVADRLAGLEYAIGSVENAPRSDYPETRVYYTPGSAGIAERLGEDLGIATQELPGGDEPRRLVVIVGAVAPLD